MNDCQYTKSTSTLHPINVELSVVYFIYKQILHIIQHINRSLNRAIGTIFNLKSTDYVTFVSQLRPQLNWPIISQVTNYIKLSSSIKFTPQLNLTISIINLFPNQLTANSVLTSSLCPNHKVIIMCYLISFI